MAGSLGDLGGLLKQAQKMQQQVQEMQESLKERLLEGSAGGGKVKAEVNGGRELVRIEIDPEVVDPDDVEMLEDLVQAAVSDALRQAEELQQAEMSKVTGGMGLPGMG